MSYLLQTLAERPPARKLAPIVHHAAMPYRDVPTQMEELRQIDSIVARALELVILTAGRSVEGARGAPPIAPDCLPGETRKPWPNSRSPRCGRAPALLLLACGPTEGATP